MADVTLTLDNFKSFDAATIPIPRFAVLVGPNAAGKSNVIEAMRFLRDLAVHGLLDAVSLQGGGDYMRNLTTDRERPVRLLVRITPDQTDLESEQAIVRIDRRQSALKASEEYEIALRFNLTVPGFRVVKERYRQELAVLDLTAPARAESAARVFFEISSTNGRVSVEKNLDAPSGPIAQEELFIVPPTILRRRIPLNISFFSSVLVRQPAFGFNRPFEGIGLYNFDSRLAKRAARLAASATLDEDGGNLASILRSILQRPKVRTEFTRLVANLLPFAGRISVENIIDKSLLFRMEDRALGGRPLPATLLSDGTIACTALVAALYFQDSELTAIEEPERSVHPKLIARLVEMLRDASETRSVLVTTHSPDVVKHAGINQLLLINRDATGTSRVMRAEDNSTVKSFLSDEVGLDDLFVQGLLQP